MIFKWIRPGHHNIILLYKPEITLYDFFYGIFTYIRYAHSEKINNENKTKQNNKKQTNKQKQNMVCLILFCSFRGVNMLHI